MVVLNLGIVSGSRVQFPTISNESRANNNRIEDYSTERHQKDLKHEFEFGSILFLGID